MSFCQRHSYELSSKEPKEAPAGCFLSGQAVARSTARPLEAELVIYKFTLGLPSQRGTNGQPSSVVSRSGSTAPNQRMTSPSQHPIDITPEPDLHPIYPSPSTVALLLAPYSGLHPAQKAELVSHTLGRACLFGDHSLLSFLFSDPQAQAFIDLGVRDEDGLGLVSLTIFGFGPESDRDVEREECVRLLVSEGADVNHRDNGGFKLCALWLR